MADVTAAAGLLRCGETCESELGAFIMYGLVVSTLHHPIPQNGPWASLGTVAIPEFSHQKVSAGTS